MQVKRVPTVLARNVRSGEVLFGERQPVGRNVEKADPIQPLEYILAAIAARSSARAACAQENLPATLIEFLGNLAARLRAADDEHRAFRQRFGIAIRATVEL